MNNKLLGIGLLTVLASASIASADLMWDEAIDGDISGDYTAPTQMFTKGTNNHVIFTTVGGTPQDREYFTFTVDAGFQLSAIILDQFDTDPETNLGFMGVVSGSVFPTPPEAPDPTALLGYALFGSADVGNDILQSMGGGGGAIGFSGPLGAGTYTFWAQETGPSTDDWDLNFVVTAVPAPPAFMLLLAAGFARKRRRS